MKKNKYYIIAGILGVAGLINLIEFTYDAITSGVSGQALIHLALGALLVGLALTKFRPGRPQKAEQPST